MRTKIICTIGPNTESEEKIKELIENGMNIARLNFSHDSHENHAKRIDNIRKWAKKLDKKVAILCDLQGPKIRTAPFENAPRKVHDGDIVVLTSSVCNDCKSKEIMIMDPYIHTDVKPKDLILIDDGTIELIVLSVENHKITCKVLHGGEIYPKKGVNLPLTVTTTSSLTDKDRADLEFILTKEPEWIAISFVQTVEDVKLLKSLMGKSKAKIMCKIETAVALDNIDSIITLSDGIMVARGDLGVEMPIERLPIIQKQIIKRCNYDGTPVVTATHMLSTMTHCAFPTRAEVTDIANAVFDGTDAVMLSNETTIGEYPVEALKTMKKIVEETENYIYHRSNNI
ncbi:MAG: pyruvate kinase [Candidatus Berkelbacteria bacterium]